MNTSDRVKKIVQEEGRTARNLVLYHVPVLDNQLPGIRLTCISNKCFLYITNKCYSKHLGVSEWFRLLPVVHVLPFIFLC